MAFACICTLMIAKYLWPKKNMCRRHSYGWWWKPKENGMSFGMLWISASFTNSVSVCLSVSSNLTWSFHVDGGTSGVCWWTHVMCESRRLWTFYETVVVQRCMVKSGGEKGRCDLLSPLCFLHAFVEHPRWFLLNKYFEFIFAQLSAALGFIFWNYEKMHEQKKCVVIGLFLWPYSILRYPKSFTLTTRVIWSRTIDPEQMESHDKCSIECCDGS